MLPGDMNLAPTVVATSFSLGGKQLGLTQERAGDSEGGGGRGLPQTGQCFRLLNLPGAHSEGDMR